MGWESRIALLVWGWRRGTSPHRAPVSRDEASAALGIACHTAKFHLDDLVEADLVAIDLSGSPNVEVRGPAGPRSSLTAESIADTQPYGGSVSRKRCTS